MSETRDPMHIIYRMNAPTVHCYEPYSTQWRIRTDRGTEACYIQTSKDESKPNWERLGDILERSLYNKINDETVMQALLDGLPVKEIEFYGI